MDSEYEKYLYEKTNKLVIYNISPSLFIYCLFDIFIIPFKGVQYELEIKGKIQFDPNSIKNIACCPNDEIYILYLINLQINNSNGNGDGEIKRWIHLKKIAENKLELCTDDLLEEPEMVLIEETHTLYKLTKWNQIIVRGQSINYIGEEKESQNITLDQIINNELISKKTFYNGIIFYPPHYETKKEGYNSKIQVNILFSLANIPGYVFKLTNVSLSMNTIKRNFHYVIHGEIFTFYYYDERFNTVYSASHKINPDEVSLTKLNPSLRNHNDICINIFSHQIKQYIATDEEIYEKKFSHKNQPLDNHVNFFVKYALGCVLYYDNHAVIFYLKDYYQIYLKGRLSVEEFPCLASRGSGGDSSNLNKGLQNNFCYFFNENRESLKTVEIKKISHTIMKCVFIFNHVVIKIGLTKSITKNIYSFDSGAFATDFVELLINEPTFLEVGTLFNYHYIQTPGMTLRTYYYTSAKKIKHDYKNIYDISEDNSLYMFEERKLLNVKRKIRNVETISQISHSECAYINIYINQSRSVLEQMITFAELTRKVTSGLDIYSDENYIAGFGEGAGRQVISMIWNEMVNTIFKINSSNPSFLQINETHEFWKRESIYFVISWIIYMSIRREIKIPYHLPIDFLLNAKYKIKNDYLFILGYFHYHAYPQSFKLVKSLKNINTLIEAKPCEIYDCEFNSFENFVEDIISDKPNKTQREIITILSKKMSLYFSSFDGFNLDRLLTSTDLFDLDKIHIIIKISDKIFYSKLLYPNDTAGEHARIQDLLELLKTFSVNEWKIFFKNTSGSENFGNLVINISERLSVISYAACYNTVNVPSGISEDYELLKYVFTAPYTEMSG
jgi:hypothetical protein